MESTTQSDSVVHAWLQLCGSASCEIRWASHTERLKSQWLRGGNCPWLPWFHGEGSCRTWWGTFFMYKSQTSREENLSGFFFAFWKCWRSDLCCCWLLVTPMGDTRAPFHHGGFHCPRERGDMAACFCEWGEWSIQHSNWKLHDPTPSALGIFFVAPFLVNGFFVRCSHGIIYHKNSQHKAWFFSHKSHQIPSLLFYFGGGADSHCLHQIWNLKEIMRLNSWRQILQHALERGEASCKI